MNSLLLWMLTTFLDSFASWFWKKALNDWKLSLSLFKMNAQIISSIFVVLLFFTLWFNYNFLSDTKYLMFFVLMVFLSVMNYYLQSYVVKNSKLSELFPYENLDKLIVIILWFILFNWTDKWVSLTTFLMTILTIFMILWFSMDFKNMKMPKMIFLYILQKTTKAFWMILVWYFLLKYSPITFAVSNWTLEVSSFMMMALMLKDDFKLLFNQNKSFYKNSIMSSIMWWSSYFMWLIIMKTSGMIVATLLWFLSVWVGMFTMKFLLNDNPTKKQIIMAFLVMTLIWIWYYFK